MTAYGENAVSAHRAHWFIYRNQGFTLRLDFDWWVSRAPTATWLHQWANDAPQHERDAVRAWAMARPSTLWDPEHGVCIPLLPPEGRDLPTAIELMASDLVMACDAVVQALMSAGIHISDAPLVRSRLAGKSPSD